MSGLNPAPGQGLSPRARGNRLEERQDVFGEGSIPACAGEPGCASDSDRA